MKWFWSRNKVIEDYSIYTTEYDLELTGETLMSQLSSEERATLNDQIESYENTTKKYRTRTSLNSLKQIDTILSKNPDIEETTAVSVVIDHSGSLRGQKAIIACIIADMIGDFLGRLGVRFEILGFTTLAWRGGNSRKRWIARWRPKNPGRLNDLLHIRYRQASDTHEGTPRTVYNLLREDILKENIDGEAVLWAAKRLKHLNADNNLIIMISDGAPVDDSTLAENGLDYLWNHLETVIADITATPGFSIAGIGIDHDVSNFYPKALKVKRLEKVCTDIPEFLGNILK